MLLMAYALRQAEAVDVTPEHEGLPSALRPRASPHGLSRRPRGRLPRRRARDCAGGGGPRRAGRSGWPRTGSDPWLRALAAPSPPRRRASRRSLVPPGQCITICSTDRTEPRAADTLRARSAQRRVGRGLPAARRQEDEPLLPEGNAFSRFTPRACIAVAVAGSVVLEKLRYVLEEPSVVAAGPGASLTRGLVGTNERPGSAGDRRTFSAYPPVEFRSARLPPSAASRQNRPGLYSSGQSVEQAVEDFPWKRLVG